MIDVVVSRYDEDISWVAMLPKEANVIVYNKGTDTNFGIPLPSIGGHGHTFIHHIVSVYDKLQASNNDYICFLTGDPFKNFTNVVEFIEDRVYIENDITLLCDELLKCDINGNPHHPNLPLETWFKEALEQEPPQEVVFSKGGQFVIHKRLIHRKPLGYFMRLHLNMITQKISPFLLERSWAYVFA